MIPNKLKEVDDIAKYVEKFNAINSIQDRYASFDLCYRYFFTNRDELKNTEMSCYVLWSYLASWGMLRNSFLLQKSPAHLKNLIEYVHDKENDHLFNVDVDSYDDTNKKIIIIAYNEIKTRLGIKKERSITLVTKIMLGVFGCIPAYDTYFSDTFTKMGGKGFKAEGLTEISLGFISEFYIKHNNIIDPLKEKCNVKCFNKENESSVMKYTRAKIIDMYGFQRALSISEDEKRNPLQSK